MVLTVCEPFGSGIVFGGKDVENRGRRIRLTGPLLIHAGKGLKWFCFADWLHDRWPECPLSRVAAMDKFKPRLGMVLGLVWFAGDEAFEHVAGEPHENRWATGPWCHPVRHARPIDPFPAQGARGLWMIPNAQLPQAVHDAADQIRRLETDRVSGVRCPPG